MLKNEQLDLLDFTFDEAEELLKQYPDITKAIENKVQSEIERIINIGSGNRTSKQIGLDTKTGLNIQHVFATVAGLKQATNKYDDVVGAWTINGFQFPNNTKYEVKALKNVTERQCVEKIREVMGRTYTQPHAFVFFRTERPDRNKLPLSAGLAYVFAKVNGSFVKVFDCGEMI